MLDLFFAAFLGVFLALGLRRPFLWVLAYLYVDIVAPQKISYFLLASIPISLIGAVRGGYDGALVWIADPINAVLTLLAVGAALYHMRLGMQVVVEDYIAKHGTKNLLLILNTFICVALFAITAYSVLKIAIAG